MKFFVISLISACFIITVCAQNYSKLVYPGVDGKLVYVPYNDKGDIIPDFSYCGYRAGGVRIPDIPIKIEIVPGDFSTDDSKRIQGAIQKLAKEKPDSNGFRGTILLKKGRYNIQNSIKIPYSGIVLRGEGNGEDGTVLIGTSAVKYNMFYIGTTDKPVQNKSSLQIITDDYIPSGTREITVGDASIFRPGDAVIIERPSTADWIRAIGMDRIPDSWSRISNPTAEKLKKYADEGCLSEDKKFYNTTIQWKPGSKNLRFERTIVKVDGNRITLDIPLTNALQKEYGGGYIYKYSFKNRPQNIGIENLRGECIFDKNEVSLTSSMDEYYSDEKHVSQFVVFGACENVWVKKLTSKYIDNGFKSTIWSRFITVEDCEYLDPVSVITGGRRYAYHIQGQMMLVQRCYARNGRHDFVLGATVAGPNAFVDNKAELCHSFSEPHQRWATGCLYDNCSVSGPEACINIGNRGFFGTGHGWSGAQMVVWNCQSPIIIVMSPPTAQNFSIGSVGLKDMWSKDKSIQSRINQINKASGSNMQYMGIPIVGNGHIEYSGKQMLPQYLYYTQLKDRLGDNAIDNVVLEK